MTMKLKLLVLTLFCLTIGSVAVCCDDTKIPPPPTTTEIPAQPPGVIGQHVVWVETITKSDESSRLSIYRFERDGHVFILASQGYQGGTAIIEIHEDKK